MAFGSDPPRVAGPPHPLSPVRSKDLADAQWQAFAKERIEAWTRDVERMLQRLDHKISKANRQMAMHRNEVQRVVYTSSIKAEVPVRTAVLRNLATQEVLLSVLDLQQHALEEDISCALYNGLLQQATENLLDVADLLDCPVGSPHMTARVMRLVTGTVSTRRKWIVDQFALRRTKVLEYVERINREFQALLPVPMRRSATGNVQRGNFGSMAEAMRGMDLADHGDKAAAAAAAPASPSSSPLFRPFPGAAPDGGGGSGHGSSGSSSSRRASSAGGMAAGVGPRPGWGAALPPRNASPPVTEGEAAAAWRSAEDEAAAVVEVAFRGMYRTTTT